MSYSKVGAASRVMRRESRERGYGRSVGMGCPGNYHATREPPRKRNEIDLFSRRHALSGDSKQAKNIMRINAALLWMMVIRKLFERSVK